MASISTAPIGLKGEVLRRLERDIRLLRVVVDDLLVIEVGEIDLGVESESEFEDE